MKEEKIENLIKKFKAGDSTLNEEQFLFDNAKKTDPAIEAWSTFVKRNEKQAPNDFNDTLWQSFQNRKTKKCQLLIGAISVAASILLIVTMALFISNKNQKELSYNEKKELQNQALSMFSDSDQLKDQKNIIYENELIIIYTSSE